MEGRFSWTGLRPGIMGRRGSSDNWGASGGVGDWLARGIASQGLTPLALECRPYGARFGMTARLGRESLGNTIGAASVAPEGRHSIARGVNPWTRQPLDATGARKN